MTQPQEHTETPAAIADRGRLTALVTNLGAAVLVEDGERRIALVNEEFCAVFAIPAPPEALTGTDCSQAAEQSKALFADPEGFVRGVADVLAARAPERGTLLAMADGRILERDYTPLDRDGVTLGNVWLYWDVTDRERQRQETERSDRAATRLLTVLADADTALGDRQHQLLDTCCELLGLEIGLISRYHGDEAEVLAARDPEGIIVAGLRVPLGQTFATLREGRDEPIAFLRSSGTERERLPVFTRYGLEAYVGVPIVVDGVQTGTLAFSSRTPRTEEFSERAVNLVRLMALWIGSDRSRRQTVEELHVSEGRAAATIRTALDGIITIGLDERVVEFNPAAEAIFGFAAADVIGRPMTELIIPPEFRDAHEQGIVRYLRTGEPRALNRRLELPALRADGSRFTCELAATAVEINGEPIAFTAYVRDISDRKQFEQDLARARDSALKAGQMKSEFLAMMSHEIRTPMNGVVGAADLLRDTPLDDRQQELVELVHQSSHSLLSIVDDVLDTAKVEAGKLDLAEDPFDLRDVVESAAQVAGGEARAKGLVLTTSVDGEVPGSLVGDPGRLRQILVNLVGNAVKFTDTGEVNVQARVAGLRGDRATVELTVTDTGVGIAHEAQERLFQPFSQVDATTTRRHGGTGLGLVISERLARLMGGGIALDSYPGRGTRMTVSVELAVLPDAPEPWRPLEGRTILLAGPTPLATKALATTLEALGAQVQVASGRGPLRERALAGTADAALVAWELLGELPPGLPQVALGGPPDGLAFPVRAERLAVRLLEALGEPLPDDHRPSAAPFPVVPVHARVLVAEDSEVNQMLLTRQLERIGVAADVVSNGREAIDAAARHRYPLILMDLRMPEVDGFDATRAIRAAETGGRVPIVAITANATRVDRAACLEAGMDDHLAKPVTLESLREIVGRWLPLAPGEDPAPAVQTGPEPIAAALDGLVEDLGGADAVERLVRRWEAELPGRLTTLQRASRPADPVELGRVAHTLRGASQIFGGEEVAAACAVLEDAVARPPVTDLQAGALVERIEEACDRARRAMHAWLARD